MRRLHGFVKVLFPTLIVGLQLLWLSPSHAGSDDLGTLLRELAIEPDRKGIEKFLQAQLVTQDIEAKIRSLVADLGNDRFQVREKATLELLKLSPSPQLLAKEAAARDAETRTRVKEILAKPQFAQANTRLLLVLRFIDGQPIKGVAPLLLEGMPQWTDQYVAHLATKAVETSAEPSDGKALRRVIAESRSGQARAAAVAALAAVLGREAEDGLLGSLDDAAPTVCLASARALLNLANRKPLPTLARLLESTQPEIREAAATMLYEVSGQQIDYASYDEPKRRTTGVAAWRAWVAKDGAAAKLHLPVASPTVMQGRILVGLWAEKVLREIDLVTRQTIFETGKFTYLWGCHATPDGHRLAVDSAAEQVIEYDSQGKECWRHAVIGQPTGVQRLANGQTLVALAEPGKVIEMDRAGTIVWQVDLQGRPTTAQRLSNGNTLVNLQDARKVVEIDPKGTVVWQVRGLRKPHTAQQLGNGHILVCDMKDGTEPGAVLEFDRTGKIVWSRRGIDNPAQAQRLPNGNTLISSAAGITEYDLQGNVVSQIHVSRARFFAY